MTASKVETKFYSITMVHDRQGSQKMISKTMKMSSALDRFKSIDILRYNEINGNSYTANLVFSNW